MGVILTKQDILTARCKEALRIIDVPSHIIDQFKAGPMLDQFCHLTIMLEMPWRDAVRWINDHRAEIMKHAESFNKQAIATPTEANRASDRDHAGSSREGQPLRIRNDGVPVDGEEDST